MNVNPSTFNEVPASSKITPEAAQANFTRIAQFKPYQWPYTDTATMSVMRDVRFFQRARGPVCDPEVIHATALRVLSDNPSAEHAQEFSQALTYIAEAFKYYRYADLAEKILKIKAEVDCILNETDSDIEGETFRLLFEEDNAPQKQAAQPGSLLSQIQGCRLKHAKPVVRVPSPSEFEKALLTNQTFRRASSVFEGNINRFAEPTYRLQSAMPLGARPLQGAWANPKSLAEQLKARREKVKLD